MRLKHFFCNISLLSLVALTAITLSGCGYSMPQQYKVQKVIVDSITSVCNSECTLKDVDVSSGDGTCSCTYFYKNVRGEKGFEDAKKYYNYLVCNEMTDYIEPFDQAKGNYTAYLLQKDSSGVMGITLKVAFTKSTYTVTITDNLIPDYIPGHVSGPAID